jgi:hypothetical protein
MTYPVKHISISINRPATEVYKFISNPENFPKWVAFVTSISKRGGDVWIGKTDFGDTRIIFTPTNEFGIADYWVIFRNCVTVNNPMRVVQHNNSCEVIFTLFPMPGGSEDDLKKDAQAVLKNLRKLKDIMESRRERTSALHSDEANICRN